MANYRTNRLLAPYKGYSILRTHSDGRWYYAAHKKSSEEHDWYDYEESRYQNGDAGELHGRSLKEIKSAVCENIAAEEWIENANRVLRER